MKKLIALASLFALVLSTTGCPIIKPMAKTALELARNACALYAEQAGLSWEQVCETEEQLRPFLDAILAGQAAAAAARANAGTCPEPVNPNTVEKAPTTEPVVPPAPTSAPTTEPVAPAAPAAAPAETK